MFENINAIREKFPVLKQKINGRPLIYLDSAASTLKYIGVAQTEMRLVEEYYGNIHRAAHYMAGKTTDDYEAVRHKIMDFIGAKSTEEIIFTRGTTESINLAAFSFGEAFVHENDEIIVSEMEHHSNLVPWQLMVQRKKAKLKMLPFDDKGELRLDLLSSLINKRTKLIAVAHVSNVLGTINPVEEIIKIAHTHGVKVMVDGAQAVPHFAVDVCESDADFYAFSSHKMYGPNGVGVLYGKKELLDTIPPYQSGGEMISEVSFEKTTFNHLPYKFEAGTPNISGVIGLGAAIDYLNELGMNNIDSHEKELLNYATSELLKIKGMQIYGQSNRKSGVISFNIDGIHPFDLGTMLDQMGVAVRTGHHCADTVMQHYKIFGTVRASFGIYNTTQEIDNFINASNIAREILL